MYADESFLSFSLSLSLSRTQFYIQRTHIQHISDEPTTATAAAAPAAPTIRRADWHWQSRQSKVTKQPSIESRVYVLPIGYSVDS